MRATARERIVVDRKRLLFVVVVVLVVLVGTVSLYANSLYASSYESHYDYRVSFAANRSLSNLTVYVPLPVEGGTVRVVGANPTANSRDETTPADAPPVTASVVDTERSVEVTASVRVNRSIDTRDPTGSEPLLAPETNRHEVPCPDAYVESQRCYAFDSAVYLAYDAPSDTRSSVWVEFAGRSEWWGLGWNGDDYRPLVSGEFVGLQDGWRPVTGGLETGFGSDGREPPAANWTG